MTKTEIEELPEVKEAAKVLAELEKRGIKEPAIGSGWTRGYLTGAPISDIDISYVGEVHYDQAQKILTSVLAELQLDPEPWDVEGIWNATLADGSLHTVEHYLKDYVCSIDTVYLAADGQLHDPTGHGFEDAQSKTLRLNDYRPLDNGGTPNQEVYICLEGCRRIAKFGWMPTTESRLRINEGAKLWSKLDTEGRAYFTNRLSKKFTASERVVVKPVYEGLGWGVVFGEG
jgi:hypothetical protein